MSRSWNGESLVNELSALLGDTTTTFKARVLGWLNDTIFDISSRHDWGYHLTKGKKILVSDEEMHDLEISAPEACEVELITGGNLTESSSYKFLFTFTQANGVETMAGAESEAVICTATDKSIKLSSLPTTDESLVSARKLYASKDGGPFYFHSVVDLNDSNVTVSIDTTSTIQAPDYESIRVLKGSPFFEGSPSVYLTFKDIDQLRMLMQGQWSSGSPQFFAPIEENKISTYPLPNSDMEVSFNYYRYPFRLYNSVSSQPDLPIKLKPILKAGVIALGYEYRDRAGQELKRANYENMLDDMIGRARRANVEYTVRDVYGNLNGFEVG